jgi:hypothetical protein
MEVQDLLVQTRWLMWLLSLTRSVQLTARCSAFGCGAKLVREDKQISHLRCHLIWRMVYYDVVYQQLIGRERCFMREAGRGDTYGYVRLRMLKYEIIRNIGQLKRIFIKIDKTICPIVFRKKDEE